MEEISFDVLIQKAASPPCSTSAESAFDGRRVQKRLRARSTSTSPMRRSSKRTAGTFTRRLSGSTSPTACTHVSDPANPSTPSTTSSEDHTFHRVVHDIIVSILSDPSTCESIIKKIPPHGAPYVLQSILGAEFASRAHDLSPPGGATEIDVALVEGFAKRVADEFVKSYEGIVQDALDPLVEEQFRHFHDRIEDSEYEAKETFDAIVEEERDNAVLAIRAEREDCLEDLDDRIGEKMDSAQEQVDAFDEDLGQELKDEVRETREDHVRLRERVNRLEKILRNQEDRLQRAASI